MLVVVSMDPSGGWSEASIGRQLHLTSKAARTFHTQRLAAAGATFGVWTILAALRSGGPMIQRELAKRLSIEGPTLTRYLGRMESDGLVRRQRSVLDRRAATVELTDAGTAAYRRLEGIATEGHRRLLRGFDEKEIAALQDMLRRIQRNVQA
jgi:MarR family transcriptional regulator for hemolysin